MYYPIVRCDVQEKIHAVRDQETCECGFVYRTTSTKIKDLYKSITFRDIKEINCRKCRSALRKKMKIN